MRLSNIARNTFGIGLGLFTMGLVLGLLGWLVSQQLSRSPVKPAFPEATKDTAKLSIKPTKDDSYPALVVYQGDLVIHDGPDAASKALDTVKFEETVVVTGQSDDGRWQHVRLESKGIEGWVAIGNVKRAQ